MQYWVAYNHCVICLCARGGWSEIPLYNNITPRSQTISTLFGNEKLRDSSVNVKPLLFGRRRHRIESVMFAPASKSSTVLPFICCDLNVCLWFCLKQLCTFVSCLSDICINLTDVTGEICVCHNVLESFECWDNELVSGMYFYVTGGFAQWSGIVKKSC